VVVEGLNKGLELLGEGLVALVELLQVGHAARRLVASQRLAHEEAHACFAHDADFCDGERKRGDGGRRCTSRESGREGGYRQRRSMTAAAAAMSSNEQQHTAMA
jgi:hypothetical protein